MKKMGPLFQVKLDETADYLIQEFASRMPSGTSRWRRYCNEKEYTRERRLGKAVGERFLLENAVFHAWRWLKAFG